MGGQKESSTLIGLVLFVACGLLVSSRTIDLLCASAETIFDMWNTQRAGHSFNFLLEWNSPSQSDDNT